MFHQNTSVLLKLLHGLIKDLQIKGEGVVRDIQPVQKANLVKED